MKKMVVVILAFMLMLAACTSKEENVIFTAIIESVFEDGIMVTTTDDVGFDKASVGYDKNCKIDFTPLAGQTVEIEILPSIRESYPVQVTAVSIKLLKIALIDMTKYTKITPKEAKEIIDNETDIIILDVRAQSEFDEGHIKNAILIPHTEIETVAVEKLTDKDAKILVYCRSGKRSAVASKKLVEMGYTNILDFGGIIDWNYETVK
ncbi:MAG: rhodanese-like domain-containing protein [Oscillospiraceae bacterium]